MVSDYVYLGSYISSSEKRKGKAWAACNVMNKIWSSDLDRNFKLIFKAAVEPILQYGSETWTLSKKHEKGLDGTYTRILMRVQNISWKSHSTKVYIYNTLPPVSSLVQSRRVSFAGHCCRAEQELISDLHLWKPFSRNKRGRKLTYPDGISRDVGLKQEDLRTAMMDREVWRGYVDSIISTAVKQ